MQGLIVIATLIALVASLVVIMTRQPAKPQPVKVVSQSKRRQLRRPKERQKRYYQRRMRTMQQQHLLLLAFVVQWQYKQLLSEATA